MFPHTPCVTTLDFIESIPQVEKNVVATLRFNIGIAEIDEQTSLPDTSSVPVSSYNTGGIDDRKHALGNNFKVGTDVAMVVKGKIQIISALNGIEISEGSDLEALCSAIQNAFIEGHESSDIQNTLNQVAASQDGNCAETFRQALKSGD